MQNDSGKDNNDDNYALYGIVVPLQLSNDANKRNSSLLWGLILVSLPGRGDVIT